jgi:hypothetical protein
MHGTGLAVQAARRQPKKANGGFDKRHGYALSRLSGFDAFASPRNDGLD